MVQKPLDCKITPITLPVPLRQSVRLIHFIMQLEKPLGLPEDERGSVPQDLTYTNRKQKSIVT